MERFNKIEEEEIRRKIEDLEREYKEQEQETRERLRKKFDSELRELAFQSDYSIEEIDTIYNEIEW